MLEDFTTYTEVDPNDHIAVSAHEVIATLHQTENAFIYKDKGVGHFGDFVHTFELRAMPSGLRGRSACWVLANAVASERDLLMAHELFLSIQIIELGTAEIALQLYSFNGSSGHTSAIDCDLPTDTWLTVSRQGDEYTLEVYSDAERTNLLATVTRPVFTTPLRYVYAASSFQDGREREGPTCHMIDLDLRPPVLCPGTPLGDICEVFVTIGDFFADLADRIDDIMFVGDALATPFVSLAGTFHDLGDTCCQASATLQDILDALEGGLTADEILALLQEHWPALAAFLEDPVAYITEIVSPLIPELPDWLDDPVTYITEIVIGILPDIPDWLTDPVAWLAAMFEEHFPLLYYLIVDPGGWLLYIVGEAFGLEPYEAQDWDFVLKALFERYFPELYLLWRELTLWAGLFEREGAVGVLTELKERFYGLAERALRFLWEGEWRTS